MRLLPALSLFLIASALARAATAQTQSAIEPLIGTWTLLPSETRASANAPLTPPRARTETYREAEPGAIELQLKTTAADATTQTSMLTFSARGGVVRQEGAPAGQMLVETRLGPRDWLVTYLANGIQYMTMRKTISADGKTMRQSVSGVTPRGETWDGLLVLERQ